VGEHGEREGHLVEFVRPASYKGRIIKWRANEIYLGISGLQESFRAHKVGEALTGKEDHSHPNKCQVN
jgi:hypothetical protein